MAWALLLWSVGFRNDCVAAGSVTGRLMISARVVDNCAIQTASLAFTAYSPTGAAGTGLGSLAISCTMHTSAKVALSQGTHPSLGSNDASPSRRMSDGAALLSYGLYRDADFTLPWGNTEGSALTLSGTGRTDSIPVYGLIGAGQDVPAGVYTDVVVVTLTF